MDALLANQIKRFSRKGTPSRVYSSSSVTATTYRTDLNVTGQGFLQSVAVYSSTGASIRLRITVDGNTAYDIGAGNANTYMPSYYNGSANVGMMFVLDVYFATSIRIESYNASASTHTLSTSVQYILSA